MKNLTLFTVFALFSTGFVHPFFWRSKKEDVSKEFAVSLCKNAKASFGPQDPIVTALEQLEQSSSRESLVNNFNKVRNEVTNKQRFLVGLMSTATKEKDTAWENRKKSCRGYNPLVFKLFYQALNNESLSEEDKEYIALDSSQKCITAMKRYEQAKKEHEQVNAQETAVNMLTLGLSNFAMSQGYIG